MRFELKSPNANQSPVYCVIRKNRKGHKIFLKYPAGFTVKVSHWNFSKQRVREINGIDYGSYNSTLKVIKDTVDTIFEQHDYFQLSGESIRKELDKVLFRESKSKDLVELEESTLFFKDAMLLYQDEENRVGIDGAKHLSNSIARLKEFKDNLEWSDIDYRMYVDFVNWMIKEQAWSKNYMGKQVKNLRKIAEYGFKQGRIDSPVYLTYKTMSEKVYNIYLNEEELTKLHEMKLPKAYERARDIFLIGCWTGQRVGTYMYIDPRDINLKKNTIALMTNKGGGKVVLPIHWQLREIIERNNGKLPESISEQRLNKYIKEICQAAKFNDIVLSEKTIKGKKTKIYKEKWEMVSSHTARRSCATNLHLRGVPISTIMLVTNHDSEQQCWDYIKELMHDEVPQKVMDLDFWIKPEKSGAKN